MAEQRYLKRKSLGQLHDSCKCSHDPETADMALSFKAYSASDNARLDIIPATQEALGIFQMQIIV